MLRKLGKLLQRKKLRQKTKGGVDSKHKVTAEKPDGQTLSSSHQPETQTVKAPSDYGVAFFGDDNVAYYTPQNATIGRKGKSFFFMPIEDSGVVKTQLMQRATQEEHHPQKERISRTKMSTASASQQME